MMKPVKEVPAKTVAAPDLQRPPPPERVANAFACPRCGQAHREMVFVELGRASVHGTAWSLCPTTGEPVFLQVNNGQGVAR